MGFFNRKKRSREAVECSLGADEFCHVITERAEDFRHTHYVIADERHYTLLYQNGQYVGQPCPYGGNIYPFSRIPAQQGTRRDLKAFRQSEIIFISKDFYFLVKWGTDPGHRYLIEDETTHEGYYVGAHGTFEVRINPEDAARRAKEFYAKLLSQYRKGSVFDQEALVQRLQDRFLMNIGAAIEDNIRRSGRSLASYVGLGPSAMKRVSDEILPGVKDIFDEYGLTITSITLNGLAVQAAKEAQV